MEVLLPHQLEVLLNGLGGDGVLSEDQDVMFSATVHLRHHQVGQKVLVEQCSVRQKATE